jgi:benzoate/toluate 1,2-dioxygenase alpha subunit
MCRGSTHWIPGPDDAAREIGLAPVLSGVRTEDEGLYTVQHRYWLDVMQRAKASQAAPSFEPAACSHGEPS